MYYLRSSSICHSAAIGSVQSKLVASLTHLQSYLSRSKNYHPLISNTLITTSTRSFSSLSTSSSSTTTTNSASVASALPSLSFATHDPAQLKHSTYDVVVVGGGMVGASLALSLAACEQTKHLKVLLVEPYPPALHQPLPTAPSIRVSAIRPSSAQYFEEMKVWPSIVSSQRVASYSSMHVWSSTQSSYQANGRVMWNAEEMGVEQLGYIIENDLIQNKLWEQMKWMIQNNHSNLEIAAPMKIQHIQSTNTITTASPHTSQQGAWPQLTLVQSSHPADTVHIKTRLLVGADGSNSIVKKYMNAPAIGWDYSQRAVVATLRTTHAHKIAYQRFLPHGPLAILPSFGVYSNLVWSTTPYHAKMLCSMNEQDFIHAVNHALRADPTEFNQTSILDQIAKSLLPFSATVDKLSDILLPPLTPDIAVPPLVTAVEGKRMFFPLRLIHASTYTAPRTVLVGDAAHVVHPLAGQGVNLGLGDAQYLQKLIATAVQTGRDIGERDILDDYESERRKENTLVMGTVDKIGKIFQPQNGIIAHLRTVGMNLFNMTPPIKNLASSYAMGIQTSQSKTHYL